MAPQAADAFPTVAPESASPAVYRGMVTPGTDAPQIYEVQFSTRSVRVRQLIHVRVLVSVNVNGVYAHLKKKYEVALPPIGPGIFPASDSVLPNVPYFLFERDYALPVVPPPARGKTYDIQFIAITRDGRATTLSVPIYLER